MAHPRTVVVGGTRGIGRAIAKLMANEGHDVMVAGRRPPDDDSLAYVMLDITDSDQVSECLSSLADAEVPLTNVVLAHRYRGQEEPWHAEIETTLTGTRTFVECFAAMAPDLPGRSVVVVSSVASQMVASEQPVSYHAAKAALIQLVRFYAVTLGPTGIRVNAVSPGTVVKEEAEGFYREHPELVELYSRVSPLRRMCHAEEVAGAVAFLCSERATFINGHDLVIDGGASALWQESLARDLSALGDLTVTRCSDAESTKKR